MAEADEIEIPNVDGLRLSDADRRRFDRECRIMGRLSTHPNVATVYQAGYTNDGRPYLVMELVDGGALADKIADGPLPWLEAVRIAEPVADAVAHAHEAGILHRDIKPENILTAEDGPRLTDFGIAYLRDSTAATSTHVTASWLHTPPETFQNERDERSDVYSLGSTIYTAVAGAAPFWRPDDESLNPLMMRLVTEPAPELPDDLAPPELRLLVARTLSKDPSNRPASAEALRDALRTLSGTSSYRATPTEVVNAGNGDPTRPAVRSDDDAETEPIEAEARTRPPSQVGAEDSVDEPASPTLEKTLAATPKAEPASTRPSNVSTDGPPQRKRRALVATLTALVLLAALAIIVLRGQSNAQADEADDPERPTTTSTSAAALADPEPTPTTAATTSSTVASTSSTSTSSTPTTVPDDDGDGIPNSSDQCPDLDSDSSETGVSRRRWRRCELQLRQLWNRSRPCREQRLSDRVPNRRWLLPDFTLLGLMRQLPGSPAIDERSSE